MTPAVREIGVQSKPTQLYRCYAVDGALLYVGISYSTVVRFAKHRKTGWSNSVGNIKVEMFPTRQAALAAELIAIRDEKPRFNIIGIPKPPKLPKPLKVPTEQLGLRLPPDVVAWLRRRGKEDMRSMAVVATIAIREAMAREERAKKRKSKAS